MKILKLVLTRKQHSAFTLIELLIAMTISSMIAVAIGYCIFQMERTNNSIQAHMTSVKQLENAIHFLNRDIQMAQKIETGGSGYWLRLTWVGWDDAATNLVVYQFDGNGNLTRTCGGTDQIIARSLSTETSNPDKIYCNYDSANHKVIIKLTTEVTFGGMQASESRDIEIIPRPSS
jgi:prepilin-type N-terminal cleavage/methylation domain-containing protein